MNPGEPLRSGDDADGLLHLQLRVARRADELAATRERGTILNLHCWLLAETEVLGSMMIDRADFIPKTALPSTPRKSTEAQQLK
ncbi:MAG: hypothetical protein ABIZ04_24295 [Opitutus sp.]